MVIPGSVLPAAANLPRGNDLTAADVRAIRIMLRGDSVVDWHRLAFSDHNEVDRFLRLNEFDPQSDDEMGRLEDIRLRAVEYLGRVFTASVPDEIAEGVAARDLFLIASRQGPLQRWACVVLKVMHIVHHLAGRAALTKLSVSDDFVFREVEKKVGAVVEHLRAAGAPIAEFEWSRKPLDSQVTKLLAKRSTLAAGIYDKLRFRIIVPSYEDLVPTLAVLARNLVPFNYVLPGESVNSLVSLDDIREATQHTDPRHSQPHVQAASRYNEFSGPDYKIINFVVDLPLRVEHLLEHGTVDPELSHVVFVLTELQIADRETAARNEQGPSAHAAYKARQLDKVRLRLFRGAHDPIAE